MILQHEFVLNPNEFPESYKKEVLERMKQRGYRELGEKLGENIQYKFNGYGPPPLSNIYGYNPGDPLQVEYYKLSVAIVDKNKLDDLRILANDSGLFATHPELYRLIFDLCEYPRHL